MTILVDLQNKDVILHIEESLALPKTDPRSPWVKIPYDQFDLYKWSKAYEEMEPIVDDHTYDMYVDYLKRQEIMFPCVWERCSLQCFKDGSWNYTGLFIQNHNVEDEEWLL